MKVFKVKSKKFYRAWMVSYLIIIIIAVVCSSVFYTLLGSLVHKTTGSANDKILTNIGDTVDMHIENMKNIVAELNYNHELNNLMNSDSKIDFIYYSELLRQKLREFSAINGNVWNIVVYCSSKSMVITPDTVCDKDMFYDIKYGSQSRKIAKSDLEEIFSVKGRQEIKSFPIVMSDKRMMQTLVLSQRVKTIKDGEYIISVFLNPDIMNQLVKGNELFDEGYLCLTDNNKNVIMSNSNEIDSKYKEFLNEGADGEKVIKNKKYVVLQEKSDFEGFEYIFAIPKKAYNRVPNLVRDISFLSVFIFLTTGLFATFKLLKKNYQPLSDLLSYVNSVRPDSAEGENQEVSDEFLQFKNAVSNIVAEKLHTENKLDSQKDSVQKMLIYNIMTGKNVGDISGDNIEIPAELGFSGNEFIVVVYYMEEFEKLFEGAGQKLDEQIQLSQLVIKNITKELLDYEFENFYMEVDDITVCIISTDDEDSRKNISKIRSIIENAKKIIKDNFYIDFTTIISNQHHSISGIPIAYGEAMEALSYRMLTNERGIIEYEDINTESEEYVYSVDTELALIEAIRAGKANKATDIINDIEVTGYKEGNLSLEIMRCTLVDVGTTLLKLCYEMKASYSVDLGEEIQILSNIISGEYKKNVAETLITLSHKLCSIVSESKDDGISSVVKLAREYIDSNYFDQNMGLNTISEKLSVSGAYLSRIFKLQMGEGLSQYINSRRMAEAQKLLVSTNLNVEEIAFKVGYANSNTFIRVFKKYNGFTPGKYRETFL